MPEQIDRREGRRLFGLDPRGYDDSRPDYPLWIFERLRALGALAPGTETLEIGPGTGKATRRLLEYGADPLTLLEPDERFAALLAAIQRGSAADCRVVHQGFEEAVLPEGRFDLIAAATSFHWIEPMPGLRKARRLLREGGAAALFWNVLQDLDKGDPFHDATDGLLSALAAGPSGAPDTVPYALDRAAREADARAAGFDRVAYFESRWTLTLDTEQVGRLYGGFSSVQRLAPRAREELLRQLMEIARSGFDGEVERNVTSCLYVLS